MPSPLFPARCMGSVVPHTPGGDSGCLYCAGTAQLLCPAVPGSWSLCLWSLCPWSPGPWSLCPGSVGARPRPRAGEQPRMVPRAGPCVAAELVATVAVPGHGAVPGLAGVIARGPEGRRCGTRGSLSDRGSALLCRGLCVPAALSIFSEISKSGNFP